MRTARLEKAARFVRNVNRPLLDSQIKHMQTFHPGCLVDTMIQCCSHKINVKNVTVSKIIV